VTGGVGLEQRYRRALRLLPGYYRELWEADMVAAFLDSWLTGDSYTDECVLEFCKPAWTEVASVILLAGRLYLGGAGAPRRFFAWGQALRSAVLTVALVQAVRGLDVLALTAWSRHLFSWLPAAPASVIPGTPGGVLPPAVWYLVAYAWIVVFVLLVLGNYRTARVLAALAILPDLVWLVQGELTGALRAPAVGPWAFWILINLVPVLAMGAFHRNAPAAAPRPWLLALPASYLLIAVPLVALQATGNSAWVPDFSGLCCILVALACLARAPRARSRRSASPGVWSLALILLAADAAAYRIFSIADYLHDPHLIGVSVAELLIVAAAAALIVPDAVRAQAAMPLRATTPAAGMRPW
jgi:hypothetical protein